MKNSHILCRVTQTLFHPHLSLCRTFVFASNCIFKKKKNYLGMTTTIYSKLSTDWFAIT